MSLVLSLIERAHVPSSCHIEPTTRILTLDLIIVIGSCPDDHRHHRRSRTAIEMATHTADVGNRYKPMTPGTSQDFAEFVRGRTDCGPQTTDSTESP